MSLAQVMDEVADLDHLGGIQANGGFVQNNHFGAAQQRGGNANALAVAFGQVADQPLFHFLQSGALHGVLYILHAISFLFHAFQLADKHQVFLHGHIGIQRRNFRQVADAGFGLLGLFLNIMAVNGNGAARGRKIPGDHVHCGGFAGAVGPQQAVNTAVLHSEADIIDRGVFSVTLGQMLDFDQWMHSPFLGGYPPQGRRTPELSRSILPICENCASFFCQDVKIVCTCKSTPARLQGCQISLFFCCFVSFAGGSFIFSVSSALLPQ